MLFRCNLKDDLHKRIKSLNRLLGKIRLRFKPQFIGPQFHQYIFLQQIRNSSVIIGNTFRYYDPFFFFEIIQSNIDTLCRFSFCGIENMCCKLTHDLTPGPSPRGERGVRGTV
jgi:hypothetical protein